MTISYVERWNVIAHALSVRDLTPDMLRTIEGMARLVAKRHMRASEGTDLEECIGVGIAAIVASIDGFDVSRNDNFGARAKTAAKRAIIDHVRANRAIGVARRDYDAGKLQRAAVEVRLDATIGEGSEAKPMSEAIGATSEASDPMLASKLAAFRETLTDAREIDAWDLAFRGDHSVADVARMHGVSRARMSQLVSGLRKRLAAYLAE